MFAGILIFWRRISDIDAGEKGTTIFGYSDYRSIVGKSDCK